MATVVTHSIRASGGDYSTLEAWNSAEARDLVAADEIERAEVYNDWPSGLPTSITLGESWITDNDRYVEITASEGERHTGEFGTGSKLFNNESHSILLNILATKLHISWLEIGIEDNSASVITQAGETPQALILDHCLFEFQINAGRIHINSSEQLTSIHNNTVYSNISAYTQTIIYIAGNNQVDVFNNVIFENNASNSITGIAEDNTSTDTFIENNIVLGCNTAFDFANYTSKTNASEDGSGGLVASTADFIDATNKNFRLTDVSRLHSAGLNYSDDYPNLTDVYGNSYPLHYHWNVGADASRANPTEVIKSIGASGRDYSSFEAWRDAEARDLQALNELAVAEVYGTVEVADFNFAHANWVTDTQRYIWVRKGDDQAKVEMNSGSALLLFDATDQSIRWTGVQIQTYLNFDRCIRFNANDELKFAALFEQCAIAADGYHCIYTYVKNTSKVIFRACLLDQQDHTRDLWYGLHFSENTSIINCGLANGLYVQNSTSTYSKLTVKNTWAFGQSNYSWGSNAVGKEGSTNNAIWDYSSGGTVPGSNPYTSDVTAADFVDPDADDWHLASGSGLADAGANLYHEYPDMKDWDDVYYPETGPWSIGLDWPDTGGGDVTVDLTGLESTTSQGQLTPSISGDATVDLTGLELTSSQGLLAPTIQEDRQVTLAGQALATSQGLLTPTISEGITVDLTGLELTSSQGLLTPTIQEDHQVTLTGLELTSSEGTITPSVSEGVTVQLTGLELTSSQGLLTPTIQEDRQVTLTGLELTSSQGSLTPTISEGVTVDLTGLNLFPSQGLLTPEIQEDRQVLLAGSELTSSEGALTPSVREDRQVTLSGQQANTNFGHLTAVTDSAVTVTLTGKQLTSFQGLLEPSVSEDVQIQLTGLQVTSDQGQLVDTIQVGLTGQESKVYQWNIKPLTGAVVPLTGLETALFEGQLTPYIEESVQVQLQGQEVVVSQGILVPEGHYGFWEKIRFDVSIQRKMQASSSLSRKVKTTLGV